MRPEIGDQIVLKEKPEGLYTIVPAEWKKKTGKVWKIIKLFDQPLVILIKHQREHYYINPNSILIIIRKREKDD